MLLNCEIEFPQAGCEDLEDDVKVEVGRDGGGLELTIDSQMDVTESLGLPSGQA